ncbi:F-box protein At3g07870-like [Cornus florida]|uniref:F-box protein At3g07870-like n=1 Tax=Cornus florida TaxID=4283 RepID=UPI00289A723D|nr:F-box protein At3g07870-like [Cornus florida]XP_059633458.1 F-box protein At3g07870-like [Cornus florida]
MMNRLTDDLVTDILSRLVIKTLMRCRCVCKLWRNLARDPRFIHSHLNNRSSQRSPSFILSTTIWFDSAFRSQIYFLEHDETLGYSCEEVSFSVPDLKEFRLISSCNGLFCLVHRMCRNIIYVCNPFTRCCTKLPNRINPSQNILGTIMGFGFNPKRNEYKVVEVVHCSGSAMASEFHSRVYVHTLGDGSWRGKGYVPCLIPREPASSEAFVCGALHWLCLSPAKQIAFFDITNEAFGFIPFPEIAVGGGGGSLSLALMDGCLSITGSAFHDHIDLWIMKDYGVKESWVKSFSICFNQVMWNNFQTPCIQGNGELLMLYKNQALFSYSPRTMTLRKLRIAGLPSWFEMVNHVGSLVSVSGR